MHAPFMHSNRYARLLQMIQVENLKARQPVPTNLVSSPTGDYRIPRRHRAHASRSSIEELRNNINEACSVSVILWKLILIEKSTGEWEESLELVEFIRPGLICAEERRS